MKPSLERAAPSALGEILRPFNTMILERAGLVGTFRVPPESSSCRTVGSFERVPGDLVEVPGFLEMPVSS